MQREDPWLLLRRSHSHKTTAVIHHIFQRFPTLTLSIGRNEFRIVLLLFSLFFPQTHPSYFVLIWWQIYQKKISYFLYQSMQFFFLIISLSAHILSLIWYYFIFPFKLHFSFQIYLSFYQLEMSFTVKLVFGIVRSLTVYLSWHGSIAIILAASQFSSDVDSILDGYSVEFLAVSYQSIFKKIFCLYVHMWVYMPISVFVSPSISLYFYH